MNEVMLLEHRLTIRYDTHAHMRKFSLVWLLSAGQDFFALANITRAMLGNVIVFNPESAHDEHSGRYKHAAHYPKCSIVIQDQLTPMLEARGVAGKQLSGWANGSRKTDPVLKAHILRFWHNWLQRLCNVGVGYLRIIWICWVILLAKKHLNHLLNIPLVDPRVFTCSTWRDVSLDALSPKWRICRSITCGAAFGIILHATPICHAKNYRIIAHKTVRSNVVCRWRWHLCLLYGFELFKPRFKPIFRSHLIKLDGNFCATSVFYSHVNSFLFFYAYQIYSFEEYHARNTTLCLWRHVYSRVLQLWLGGCFGGRLTDKAGAFFVWRWCRCRKFILFLGFCILVVEYIHKQIQSVVAFVGGIYIAFFGVKIMKASSSSRGELRRAPVDDQFNGLNLQLANPNPWWRLWPNCVGGCKFPRFHIEGVQIHFRWFAIRRVRFTECVFCYCVVTEKKAAMNSYTWWQW